VAKASKKEHNRVVHKQLGYLKWNKCNDGFLVKQQ